MHGQAGRSPGAPPPYFTRCWGPPPKFTRNMATEIFINALRYHAILFGSLIFASLIVCRGS